MKITEIGRTPEGTPMFQLAGSENAPATTNGRAPMVLNHEGPGGKSANVTSPESGRSHSQNVAVSGSSGGSNRLDERSTQLMDQFLQIATRSISDESIEEEKKSLQKRLKEAEAAALSAMYMSMGGNGQTGAVMLQQAGEEMYKAKYLLGQIEADPTGYKHARLSNVAAQFAPVLQGAASLSTAMYLPASLDVQRYGYGASYAQAGAYRSAGAGTGAGAGDMDDKNLVQLLALIMDNTPNGKSKNKLLSWITNSIGIDLEKK